MDKNLKYLCVSVGVEMKSTIFSYPLSYHQAIADISESNKTNIYFYQINYSGVPNKGTGSIKSTFFQILDIGVKK